MGWNDGPIKPQSNWNNDPFGQRLFPSSQKPLRGGNDGRGLRGGGRFSDRYERLSHPHSGPKKGPGARFIADSSLPDRSLVTPGLVLKKTWNIENSGETAWPAGVKLYCVRGTLPVVSDMESKIECCQPGQVTQVTAIVRVPMEEGRYTTYFRLGGPDGRLFGTRLWCDLIVGVTPVVSKPVGTTIISNPQGEINPEEEHDKALAMEVQRLNNLGFTERAVQDLQAGTTCHAIQNVAHVLSS